MSFMEIVTNCDTNHFAGFEFFNFVLIMSREDNFHFFELLIVIRMIINNRECSKELFAEESRRVPH